MEKKTHKILDLVYTKEEGQDCFVGTFKECTEYIDKQPDFFMYKIVELSHEEYIHVNK